MSENKKQHYVPQFYLKNFSQDKKRLFIYHLASEKSNPGPISSTCQEKYFYGNDGEFEKVLSEMETSQAKVIKKILKNGSVKGLSSKEFSNLLIFIMLQLTRTRDAKNSAENIYDFFAENFILPMIKGHEKLKKYPPELLELLDVAKNPEFYKTLLVIACKNAEGISDLKPFLLINKTSKPFIASDSPIVLNNIIKLGNLSMIGFLSPGLQIICPLCDTIALLLVDAEPYKIQSNPDSTIYISVESDVDNLNFLQVLNCFEVVFSQRAEDEKYINKIHDECKTLKITKAVKGKEVCKISKPNVKQSTVTHVQQEGMNYSMRFSFLKLDHEKFCKFKARFEKLSKESDAVIPCRNEKYAQKVNDKHKNLFKKAKDSEEPK